MMYRLPLRITIWQSWVRRLMLLLTFMGVGLPRLGARGLRLSRRLPDTWCLMPDAWCLMPGAWCLMPGA